jgi:hypothetical protein
VAIALILLMTTTLLAEQLPILAFLEVFLLEWLTINIVKFEFMLKKNITILLIIQH